MIDKETMRKTYGAAYPGVWGPGHNLWPLKFVTHVYKLAQAHIDLTLHTRTPVTSVTASPRGSRRAWTLHTPRGPITCAHVVHATNAYASHLLPRFAGPGGIVPTRGQVIALRANARLEELGTSSWDGNEGFEYWFPRPLRGSDAPDGRGDAHPLVILGGGREASGPGFEYYETDDSTLHPDVGRALKGFLHSAFPGKFADGRQPEMEWVRCDIFSAPLWCAHGDDMLI
ncbi:hypothetical protein BD779DRAFT_1543814 [Infundibulicybe gibba]|nr:hypothetical protein BD779DRAFT_1543814 [Infundibulicybe gibba]